VSYQSIANSKKKKATTKSNLSLHFNRHGPEMLINKTKKKETCIIHIFQSHKISQQAYKFASQRLKMTLRKGGYGELDDGIFEGAFPPVLPA